jgi:hypothetical protein
LGVSEDAAIFDMNVNSAAVGVSFVLVTLLGNGAFWEYRKAQVEKQRLELETEKRRLETMAEAFSLRQKQSELLFKLSSMAGQYHEILAAKAAGRKKMGVYPVEHKRRLLDAQVDQLLSDYDAIENNLAKIENRQPRRLNAHHFKPPPEDWQGPQNIRIEEQ